MPLRDSCACSEEASCIKPQRAGPLKGLIEGHQQNAWSNDGGYSTWLKDQRPTKHEPVTFEEYIPR